MTESLLLELTKREVDVTEQGDSVILGIQKIVESIKGELDGEVNKMVKLKQQLLDKQKAEAKSALSQLEKCKSISRNVPSGG